MVPPIFDLAVLVLYFAQAAISIPSDHRYKERDPVPLYNNKPLPMNGSIVSWLLLAISMISISFEVAGGSASAQCLGVDQRLLLLKLRNSLVFDASKSSMLVQWDRSGDSWSGVTCEDGLVIGLDLSNESISGGIDGSSSLFRLEFLRSLNLAFNYFNYLTIPSGIANLSRLVHLNLSNAGFAGKIPAELSRLRKLRSLDLTCLSSYPAFLKLEKPSLRALIGDLVEFRELYLDLVDVSAEGSGWCDALSSSVPKLEVLSMSNCSLSGPMKASLMSLANLSVIQLYGNNFYTTVPKFLANFSSLKTLSLAFCGLYGEFPREIFQAPTLKTLDLSLNMLLRGPLPEFPAHSSLQNLFLSNTNISGTLPVSIGNLEKLSSIELVNCSFRGSIPSSIVKLPLLALLDFSFNQFSGPVPPFASRNLTQIRLSHNDLTGKITSIGWEDLLNLEYLDLRNNLLEGNISSSLLTLTRLEMIHLSHNRFSGQLTIYPNVCSYQLGMLDLGSNQLQGPIPASIFKLQGLGYLSLSSNNFSGSMNIDALRGFGNLAYHDLSYNGMSINTMASASAAASSFPDFHTLKLASCQLRSLPQFLANQSTLVSLDLSHNYIQGEIPRWIWTREDLLYLNLSSNLFVDLETPLPNIPSDLAVVDLHLNMLQGNMLPLPSHGVYLDFSSNYIDSVIPDDIGDYLLGTMFFSLSKTNFHGSIPKSIYKAEFLQVLDLSRNHLNGTIPDCFVMKSLKMLQIIDLSSNDFGGMLPESLLASWEAMKANVDFNHLEYEFLPLSGLNYQDTMSVTLKGLQIELVKILTIFTSIDFSGNRLEGPIPDTFGDLKALYFLNLSHNVISGSIPSVLGNLHQLELLDLS
ncbi:receptor-like protein 6 [Syzygium oleosum]|uniref:receptor-like protein 6 n=1 Tax=Syzygium oleosum TaxID=219896 RepID=UPI0024B91808|nr:receptor-like protein 6 [Syzygium oleosum]